MKEIAAAIITETGKLKTKKDHLLIAVDGRCGSGKSTLGAYLQQKMHGNLLQIGNGSWKKYCCLFIKERNLRIDHLTVGNGNWISRWRWKQGRSILWKGLILVIQSYMTTMIFMCF